MTLPLDFLEIQLPGCGRVDGARDDRFGNLLGSQEGLREDEIPRVVEVIENEEK